MLCLGAHCDDIEIGCGGTVMTLLQSGIDVCVRWIVFSANKKRAAEARHSAQEFLSGAKSKKVTVLKYRDGFLPYVALNVKEDFEKLKSEFNPHLIFTHYRNDRHQDHRLISELTWNTWRDHFILEYEIPKYDGDLGAPNCFVSVQTRTFDRKVKAIQRFYLSQQNKKWFERTTFDGLARLRGMECNSPTKIAEAFYCHKIIFKEEPGNFKR
jgi:LmbE family N-acetylglucosaminyl deacetylase